jgi:hypothetical protein
MCKIIEKGKKIKLLLENYSSQRSYLWVCASPGSYLEKLPSKIRKRETKKWLKKYSEIISSRRYRGVNTGRKLREESYL